MAVAVVTVMALGAGVVAPAKAAGPAAAPTAPDPGHTLIWDELTNSYIVGSYTAPYVATSDDALWSTDGLQGIVRTTTNGSVQRFDADPGMTLTSNAIGHLYADGTGVYYGISDTGGPHVRRMAADGTIVEVPLPTGTRMRTILRGPDGSVWVVAEPLATGVIRPDTVVRLAGATRQESSVPRPSGFAFGTDGALWLSTSTTVNRVGADGSVSQITVPAGRNVEKVWAGTGGSAWYLEYVSPQAAVIGLAAADGTSTEATVPDGAFSLRPMGTDATTGSAWLTVTGSSEALVGTTPSSLQGISLPAEAGQNALAVLSGGRLWIATPMGDTAALHGDPRDVYAVGADGTVSVDVAVAAGEMDAIAAGPDGTIWITGRDHYGNQIVDVHPDGTAERGAYPYPAAFDGPPDTFTSDGRPWFQTPSGAATVDEATSDRLGGATRYDAAAAIAEQAYPSGTGTVYIASGQNFPDALSAGPLAAATGGALLLTTPGALPDATRAAIGVLKPQKIVVIGGSTAVSDGVLASLLPLAPTVQRLTGSDRYVVSRSIVAANQQAGRPLFIATGAGFADAVTAGAAAARQGAQLLLVPGGDSGLPDGYASFIAGLHPSSIAVVGGPAAVSDGIVAQLGAIAGTTRYGGADRFAVSAAVVRAFGSPSAHVYLTTGLNFPDALAAAPLAGRADATIVSVGGTCVPADTLAAIDAAKPSAVTVLGGPDAVSADMSWLHTC